MEKAAGAGDRQVWILFVELYKKIYNQELYKIYILSWGHNKHQLKKANEDKLVAE